MKNFCALIVALFLVNRAMAQWFPINTGMGSTGSIFFTDVNTGYADGWYEGFLKTIDGGVTWSGTDSICCGPVFFLNADTGWDGTFWRTNDGGLTWTLGTGGSYLASSIYFTDKDTGYAVGGHWGIDLWPLKYIGKTTDGGANWMTLSSNSDTSLNSVFFTNANIGYTVGHFGTILKTTDGGSTWISQSSGTNLELFEVFFPSQDTGYIVGQYGIILKTVNGGSVWIQQSSGTSVDLLSVSFTDVNTGYVVGTDFIDDVILKTTNGGLTWWFQSTAGTCGEVVKVFFPSADTGYILTYGCILKTENGGGFPVGIGNLNVNTGNLSIIPNPAFATITIKTSTEGSLFIYNTSGQRLLQQEITEPNTTIDVSTLPNGVYFVRLTGDKNVSIGKFVKQ